MRIVVAEDSQPPILRAALTDPLTDELTDERR
jgi:hypothetical protein